MTTPADLPDSVEDLRALVLSQQAEIEAHAEQAAKHEQTISEYTEEIGQLREYIRLLKSQHFGPRSERASSEQMGLFNEAEATAEEGAGEEAEAGSGEAVIEVPAHTRRKRGGRRPLPAYLPREEIVHDVPEE